jgi:hypothetical protein
MNGYEYFIIYRYGRREALQQQMALSAQYLMEEKMS